MDTSITHADLFFFISSLGFIIIFLVVLVGGLYVLRILKNVKDLSQRIKTEGEVILDDVHEFRHELKSKGSTAMSVLKGMLGAFGVAHAVHRARRKSRPVDDEDAE